MDVVSIRCQLDLLGLVLGTLVWETSAGRGLRQCSRRSQRTGQERLVSRTRRLDNSQPGRIPLFPRVSVRETDWPPLWPIRIAVGDIGTGQPGVLYPAIYIMQLCSKEAPEEEAEVEKEDGKTSVPAQAENSSCTETGLGGGLRGAGAD